MSELRDFRDHCRVMATWTDPREEATRTSFDCTRHEWREVQIDHDRCTGFIGALTRFAAKPDLCACACHPRHPGPTDAERALWTQIADEIDAYLSNEEGQEESLL